MPSASARFFQRGAAVVDFFYQLETMGTTFFCLIQYENIKFQNPGALTPPVTPFRRICETNDPIAYLFGLECTWTLHFFKEKVISFACHDLVGTILFCRIVNTIYHYELSCYYIPMA